MNLSKQFTLRERILLMIMGVIILLGAYMLLVQQPVANQRQELALAITDAEDEQLILQTKADMVAKMKAELEALPYGVAETPAYDNLRQVVDELNAVMAATQEYTMSFRPVELPESGAVVRRSVDMTFTCADYGSARAAVAQLHNSAYRCQIGNLTVEAQSEGKTTASLSDGAVTVTLTITYFEAL